MKVDKTPKTNYGIKLSKTYKSSEVNEDKLKNYIYERYSLTSSKKRN